MVGWQTFVNNCFKGNFGYNHTRDLKLMNKTIKSKIMNKMKILNNLVIKMNIQLKF